MAAGRIRGGGPNGYQGVSMVDNWRTPWCDSKAKAQQALDAHLEELAPKKPPAKKPPQVGGGHVNVADFLREEGQRAPR